MKKGALTALLVLVFTTSAFSADIIVSWRASTGATGYIIEASMDNGTTWTTKKDIGAIVPVDYVAGTSHILLCSYTWTGLPDTGLVLIRVIAYNSIGQACRTEAGSWFNKAWSAPDAPTGVGIQ